MPGYLIKDTTKKKNVNRSWRNLLEIFPRTVMAVWRDLRICIRIILTERKRSVRSIWSSMPGMSMEIWIKRKNEAARCSEREINRSMDQNEVKYDKLLKIKTTGRDDSQIGSVLLSIRANAVREVLERLAYCGYLGKKESSDRLRMWKRQSGFFFWRGRSDAGPQAWSTMNV